MRTLCDDRPLKEENSCTQLTTGGDVLEYAETSSSPASSLLETKIIIKSVISDAHKGSRFMTAYSKDYFLQSKLLESEYLLIHGTYFLKDIREKYAIDSLVAPDGYVYCKIVKVMYDLKQAVKLARDQLIENLQ